MFISDARNESAVTFPAYVFNCVDILLRENKMRFPNFYQQ